MFGLNKTKRFKINLGTIAILLVVLSLSFLVYATSSSKFELNNVVICRNLDKNAMPIDIVENEIKPSDRLILVFDYSNANIGQVLNVIWFFNDKQITNDQLKLNRTEGQRRLALLSNSGATLPKGAYCVKISIGDKLLQQLSFIIS